MIRPPYGHCPYNTPKPPMGCCLFKPGFRFTPYLAVGFACRKCGSFFLISPISARGSPESPRILPKPSWMRSVQVRSSAIHILSPKVLCGYYPHTTPKPPMGCCLFRSGFRHLLTYPFVAEPRKGLDDLKYGHENVRPSMKVSPVLCGRVTFCRVSLSFPLIICTDTVRTTCRNQRNAARSGRAFGTTHQPDET